MVQMTQNNADDKKPKISKQYYTLSFKIPIRPTLTQKKKLFLESQKKS